MEITATGFEESACNVTVHRNTRDAQGPDPVLHLGSRLGGYALGSKLKTMKAKPKLSISGPNAG